MGTLVFVCPTIADEVSTGVEIDLETLVHLGNESVRCPCCLQLHQLGEFQAWTTGEEILPEAQSRATRMINEFSSTSYRRR
jgi:hypothetical protein